MKKMPSISAVVETEADCSSFISEPSVLLRRKDISSGSKEKGAPHSFLEKLPAP